jgi:hypothetical protein
MMAYPYNTYEVTVKVGADLNALADAGVWSPGLAPHVVRGVAIVNQNVIGGAGEVRLDLRPLAYSDTNRGDGDVAIVTIPNALPAGQVLYKMAVNGGVKVSPGQQVVVQVTDVTATGDLGDVIIQVERMWENPLNNALMTASA